MPRPKMGKRCSLWFCHDKHYAKGLCHRHYSMMIQHGQPLSPKNKDAHYMLAKVMDMRDLIIRMAPMTDQHTQREAAMLIARLEEEHTPEVREANSIGRCENCGLEVIAEIRGFKLYLSCQCHKIWLDMREIWSDHEEQE